jgi:hypothetical protein
MAYPGDERDPDAPIELGDDDRASDEQLILADPDERLPWLESVDDDEPDGADTSRMVAFALTGLLAVVALVGLLWWLTRDRPDPAMVADGSVIEAPAAYKERPEKPGGTEVSGTGNTSFAVGEGRNVETRIGAGTSTPAAIPSATSSSGASTAAAAPAVAAGVGVQVGAYSTKATAEAGWQQLASRLAPLQGRSHRVLEGTADSGTIYRLQAVAGSVAEAEELCRNLRAAGGDCQVKR